MSSVKLIIAASLLVTCCLLSATVVEAKTQAALKCPAGSAPSITACRAPITSSTPLSGSGYCCSCPPGSFSANGLSCSRCVSGLVAQSGVDLQQAGAQCACLPGFGDYDPSSLTCRRCPINTYSSSNKCVPCAAGTFSAAQSGSCAAVSCPLDSYLPPGGATVADCVRCKFGTLGQSCTTVTGCRCMAGYAAFDKTSGQCQQCTGINSVAVFADMTVQDVTKTVCAQCPAGTFASADKRTCNPAQVASSNAKLAVTPFPATAIPALTCASLPSFQYSIQVVKKSTNVAVSTYTSSTSGFWPTSGGFDLGLTSQNIIAAGQVFALLVDAGSNLVVAAVSTNVANGDLTFYNGNSVKFAVADGLTCAQAIAASYVQPNTICIVVGQSASFSSITSQFASQGVTLLTSDYDLQFSFTAVPVDIYSPAFGCTPSTLSVVLVDLFTASTVADVAAFSPSSQFGTVTGTGAANFGSKVIAMTDANNVIQIVIAKSTDATKGNFMVSTDATSFPMLTTPCAASGNVAACLPMTLQLQQIGSVMNSIAAGASDSSVDLEIFIGCD